MENTAWYHDPQRVQIVKTRLQTAKKCLKKLMGKYPDRGKLLGYLKKTYGYWNDRAGFVAGNQKGNLLELSLVTALLSLSLENRAAWPDTLALSEAMLSRLKNPSQLQVEQSKLAQQRAGYHLQRFLRSLSYLIHSDCYWSEESG